MDISKLERDQRQLIEYLQEARYSSRYIESYRTCIRYIIEYNSEAWNDYLDVFEAFKSCHSESVNHHAHAVLGGIRRFHVEGGFPDGSKKRRLTYRDPLADLPECFSGLVSHCIDYERTRNKKKESSIQVEAGCCLSFLKGIRARGCKALDEITEEDVVGFFLLEGKLAKSASYTKKVRAVFKVGLAYDEASCTRVLGWMPKIRRSRKNIQYLAEDEVAGVKAVIEDAESALCLRDRAIGLLLVHYGLRGCDIASLRRDSIDWGGSMLRIRQQKTGATLELPLVPVVGNAIYDYLARERGNSDSPRVFLANRAPYGSPIGSAVVQEVAGKLFDLAGLRQNVGDRRGSHIFRHNVATSMLSAGVPQPVISRTLGHSSPTSTEAYLSADFVHLRECALSIARFPVSGEVRGYGI